MSSLNHQPSCVTPHIIPTTAKSQFKIQCKLLQPPVIVNLREDAQADDKHTRELLTEQELNYFKTNGNNATVFIHGFNVEYGQYASQIDDIYLEPAPGHMGLSGHKVAVIRQRVQPATTFRSVEMLQARFPIARDPHAIDKLKTFDLNGTDAHKWFIHMEYELNRAAGFKEAVAEHWEKYTRLVHVAWSGDVRAVNYLTAEKRATAAGRRLAKLIIQLHMAGIKVNVIAHSLGNRVLLVALNLIGQIGWHEIVEHAFMWQPAIPDTALSNDPEIDSSILRNWQLIHAHKVAKRFVVLHSEGDNVLGGHTGEPTTQLSPQVMGDGVVEHFSKPDVREDLTPGKDGERQLREVATGSVGGAYGVATQIGVPLYRMRNGVPVYISYDPDLYIGHYKNLALEQNWNRLLEEVSKQNAMDKTGTVVENLNPQVHEIFLPIMYYSRMSREAAEDFLKSVRALKNTDFEVKSPRPAMGWRGLEEAKEIDVFIRQSIDNGKFVSVNQTPWLHSHSGMLEPTDKLREEVYQKVIFQRIKKEGGGFGKY